MMASRTKSLSHPGRWPVKAAVGVASSGATIVADAAPITETTAMDTNRPSAGYRTVLKRFAVRGR